MSRRLKVQTRELGFLELYLIYQQGSEWEEEWKALQEHLPVTQQLPRISKEEMEQALQGWTRPLVKVLGPEPRALLLCLPREYRQCWSKKTCPFFSKKDCTFLNPNKPTDPNPRLPWCFSPGGVEDEIRPLVAEIIRLWREQVYVVLVQEPCSEDS